MAGQHAAMKHSGAADIKNSRVVGSRDSVRVGQTRLAPILKKGLHPATG